MVDQPAPNSQTPDPKTSDLQRPVPAAPVSEGQVAREQGPPSPSEADLDTAVLLHQLRNPLTAIATLTKLLQKRLDSEDENYWVIERLGDECQHLQALVAQFAANPTRPWEERQSPLQTWLAHLAATYGAIAQERHLTFETHWQIPPDLITPAPLILRQIMANLLDNALKYTPAGGLVELGAYLTAADLAVSDFGEETLTLPEIPPPEISPPEIPLPALIFWVRDTGVGIGPEALPHVFSRYYRGSTTQPGQGLGLAIAQALAQQLGGKIEVHSQLGVGTTFSVRLPAPSFFPSSP